MESSSNLKSVCKLLKFKSFQLFIVAGTVLLALLVSVICVGITVRYEVESEVVVPLDVDYWKVQVTPQQQLWYDRGIEELQQALRVNSKSSVSPKNVLIFLLHGLDGSDLAAARFGQENSTEQHTAFVWDQFPHVARLKNSCSKRAPCDATAVAQALWSGVPHQAMSTQSLERNCSAQLDKPQSILRQAQLAGFRTGFVTNQRITGATAAALYAQVADSSWECDGIMPLGYLEQPDCQDVAEQLIKAEAAQALNVLMGGGRQLLSAKVPTFSWDPLDEWLCRARVGRNLLRDWRNQRLKQKPRQNFELVQQANELGSLNASKLDYLLAVLANADLSHNTQAPTLQLMLNKTLEVLQRPKFGHLLIVEHFLGHKMNATQQLRLLNATIAGLLNQRHTLFLVLLTKGNYIQPSRDVSGEMAPFSTLEESFAQSEQQLQLRLRQMSSETLLFARGPKSLLFQGVHEETYLAQALSYVLGLNSLGKQVAFS